MDNAMGMLQIAVDAYNDHCRTCVTCRGTWFGPNGTAGTGTTCWDGWKLVADIEAKAAIGSKRNAEGVR